MGTCSLYFHSSCVAGVDSRNRAEISFYARNHLPCSWHCWHFHRTNEIQPHRNFLRHAASMSPEMKRMDMTGLNGSHMFSAGCTCICQLIWTKFAKMGTERERRVSDKTWNALQKGNLQANFANSMDFGKGETRSFGLFHGTFTAWCTLWQISFVGDVDSSRFLGQAWTSLGKRTAERLKVKRHGEGQLSAWSLTDVDGCWWEFPPSVFQLRLTSTLEDLGGVRMAFVGVVKDVHLLSRYAFERWRPSTISTATNSTC